MKKICAIAQKELSIYFKSPIAYIVFILTISVLNILFFAIIDENREASLSDVFLAMEFMFVFFLPLITMKIFSEEKSSGTIEFLMTAPVKTRDIVMGKYLGSLLFFTMMIMITFVYYAIVEVFGSPDSMAILVGFLGIWLEGAFFISIGMLASSWTKNQVVAAITTYVVLFVLYSSMIFIKYFSGSVAAFIKNSSTYTHAGNFFTGIVSVSDIVYYLSGIVVAILLTTISLENKS